MTSSFNLVKFLVQIWVTVEQPTMADYGFFIIHADSIVREMANHAVIAATNACPLGAKAKSPSEWPGLLRRFGKPPPD